MDPRSVSIWVAALLAAIGLTARPAPAAPLDESLKVRETANQAAVRSQRQVDELSDRTEDLLGDYRSALKEVEALRVYNAQLEKVVAAQETEAAGLTDQIDRVALVGRQLTPLMLEMIDTLEAFIELDVPFLRKERGERVARLRELMERADVDNSERYRRILEAYQIESEYGRTIEAYSGALEGGDGARTVDFLRVGRVALVYQTLDGEEVGMWDPKASAWRTLPGDYRLSIRQGLRIARKQAAPDLIRLPLPAAEVQR